MTKRLKSKHKVDRRLKANIWGRPKSPFNSRAYPPGQHGQNKKGKPTDYGCLLYTSPSPRDATLSRMPSSA